MYDLLVIFTDNKSMIITDVSESKFDERLEMFSYVKDDYRSFLPKENVKYFGRKDEQMRNQPKRINEVVYGLMDLIVDKESFVDPTDPDCIFQKDVEILQEALKLIQEGCIW